ncbi:MAG: polyhydroxyalkanoate synthesis repressor PhaR [Pseudomonadota bacterium]
MAKAKNGHDEPTVIKKYANRRLYDTGRSSYVTLDDLCEMVKDGIDFVVCDAKTGEDLTRSVLTQIIVDQEAKGENLLPTGFLKNLIGFYGGDVQSFVPNYLEQSMEAFVKNQEHMREHINKSLEGMNNMQGMFPGVPGSSDLEEMSRKNMEMFENTMKMFMPFNGDFGSDNKSEKK